MIRKKPVKGTDKVSVTFSTGAGLEASSVHVVGDFNGWDRSAHPMKQRKDGSWAATIRLPQEQEYQFLYLVDGARWVTDYESDGNVGNPYGSENAIVKV